MSGLRLGQTSLRGGICWSCCRWIPRSALRTCTSRSTGENGLEATAPPDALAPAPEALETHTYANDLGPAAADGHHVVTGWVARIPVTLTPTKPWDIGGVRYPLRVTGTYHVAGESADADVQRTGRH